MVGSGPAVIVIAEIPGISPQVARFSPRTIMHQLDH
jgi:dienelactone hydrolase